MGFGTYIAARLAGRGAPLSCTGTCGAQQSLIKRARSRCISASCLSHARTSRKTLAACSSGGSTTRIAKRTIDRGIELDPAGALPGRDRGDRRAARCRSVDGKTMTWTAQTLGPVWRRSREEGEALVTQQVPPFTISDLLGKGPRTMRLRCKRSEYGAATTSPSDGKRRTGCRSSMAPR